MYSQRTLLGAYSESVLGPDCRAAPLIRCSSPIFSVSLASKRSQHRALRSLSSFSMSTSTTHPYRLPANGITSTPPIEASCFRTIVKGAIFHLDKKYSTPLGLIQVSLQCIYTNMPANFSVSSLAVAAAKDWSRPMKLTVIGGAVSWHAVPASCTVLFL